MSKIVLLADIHFGVPDRTDDILYACRVAREYCSKMSIDTVVILGDLFHDRKNLGIEILSVVCKFFEECAEQYQQKWIVFPGNHDMFLRHSWSINSLLPLKKHLTVIGDVKQLILDEVRNIWILPFITYEKPYMSVLGHVNQMAENGDVLFTHIGTRGATLNTCFLLKDWSHVDFGATRFSRIYTGHFHSRQQVGQNLWYPGSLIPFKFDEGDVTHGFFVYDTVENSHKFIDIWKAGSKLFPDLPQPPQFYTITDADLDNPQDWSNGIVRVALAREYNVFEKKTMSEKLLDLGVKSVRWMNPTQKVEATITKSADPTKNIFETWLAKDAPTDLDYQTLLKLHSEITVEGDEMYSTMTTDDY